MARGRPRAAPPRERGSTLRPAASEAGSPVGPVDLGPAVAALLALGRDGTHPAGAVVGVLVDGRLATAAGGVAVAATGAEPARPMTPDTRLDLASVTKVASTTALAMRLVTDGLLHLEFPVTHYLPSFGSSGRGVPGAGASGSPARVTVRHLLEHTSGLPPWVPLYCRTTDRDEALALVLATPLVAEPGVRWAYSDLGMMVLGAVIEAVTGMRQDAAFAERLAAPLGLSRTAYGPVPTEESAAAADSDVVEHRMVATGDPYPTEAVVGDFSGWRDCPVIGTSSDGNAAHALGGVAGHAGLFATVPELLRMGQSLVDPDAVPAPVIAEFTRPLAVDPDRGLGFRLATSSLPGNTSRLPTIRVSPAPGSRWRSTVTSSSRLPPPVCTRPLAASGLHATTGQTS